MDEGRKRVIGLMAAVLSAIHMQRADDLFGMPNRTPITDRIIEASNRSLTGEWLLQWKNWCTRHGGTVNGEPPRCDPPASTGAKDANTLRRQIIDEALELKPSPEIPEEARRHFVKADTLIARSQIR